MDLAIDLVDVANTPIVAVVRSPPHPYFSDIVFSHPHISRRPEISHISPKDKTVFFKDGTQVENIDKIILGTGYKYSYPFLEGLRLDGNRVNGLYLHVFNMDDPRLVFIGAVSGSILK